MNLPTPPSTGGLLSERAERWIIGDLDSDLYFTLAHHEARLAARLEVLDRLNRHHRSNTTPRTPTSPPAH
jgi:hypothetical protein